MSSCDTFVVFPPLTSDGSVIFGKNSDRPLGEVQEIVYFPPRVNASGAKLQVTYIEIDEVEGDTQAVILSKPSWMWGAEMGANSSGVVCGNEAVFTKVDENKNKDSLLGMDLVRLCLERSKCASEGVDVITSLLEKYGQGGPCNTAEDMFYHNSFLIVDSSEAWVLETAGKHWAAQKITSGHRNISNSLSITTNIDRKSENLISYAIENGLWNNEGEFNFKEAYMSGDTCERETSGYKLLEKESSGNSFTIDSMFRVLRDKESGICRPRDHSFHTASSQVSVLSGTEKPAFHWFTGTPDPSMSVFKPFAFTPNSKISQHTVSPDNADDRRHNLYKLHEVAHTKTEVIAKLQSMELECVSEVKQLLESFTPGQSTDELDELLKDIVETEVRFYK